MTSHNAQSVEPTPQELALKAIEYLQSPAGIAAMRKSARESKAFADRLRKCRDIPWELLHAPFTI